LSAEKSTNSQIIREISPDGTSGLWREEFMEKKCSDAEMKEYRSDGREEW